MSEGPSPLIKAPRLYGRHTESLPTRLTAEATEHLAPRRLAALGLTALGRGAATCRVRPSVSSRHHCSVRAGVITP